MMKTFQALSFHTTKNKKHHNEEGGAPRKFPEKVRFSLLTLLASFAASLSLTVEEFLRHQWNTRKEVICRRRIE
jgi:hypothetical protein